MIKYERQIIQNILIAPINQIGVKTSDPKWMFKAYVDDKTFPTIAHKMQTENQGTEMVVCVFCQIQKINTTYPVFEVDEKNSVISLRKIEHVCNKCKPIALLTEDDKTKEKAVKRLQELIDTTNDFMPGSYKGDLTSSQLINKMLKTASRLKTMDWTWDLMYLKRRGLSENEIYHSSHNVTCPTSIESKGKPFLWSEYTRVKDFYDKYN